MYKTSADVVSKVPPQRMVLLSAVTAVTWNSPTAPQIAFTVHVGQSPPLEIIADSNVTARHWVARYGRVQLIADRGLCRSLSGHGCTAMAIWGGQSWGLRLWR